MEEPRRRRKRRDPWRSIGRSTVSFVCVCFAHFALYLLSSFFHSFNIITLLFLSVIVLLGLTVIGRRCKKLFGLRGSAPAFVFANILFIWCVYVVVIQQATSLLLDIIFNVELVILLIGLYRIISGDPGFVNYEPISNTETYLEESELPTSDIYEGSLFVESSLLLQRIRYCTHCHAHVKGFDHHCPAFGSCIGQNNHLLFIILLAGFVTAEACYILGASQSKLCHIFHKLSFSFLKDLIYPSYIPVVTTRTLHSDGQKVGWTVTLATSTMLFSILQVLWQVAFLAWHIYCVCFNIRTDEWMHWKQYPEFQHIMHPQLGETGTTRFRNPYDKGIWLNLKEFIEAKG
ncbi:palmitoyltransferase AKR1-like [Bidens hawaiensis]|uniref:palmitoyltransferase AKR1-like n=1 Tax=Bidens hawaiensis TaxID=980011 RepID=UPI0040496B37